MRKNIIQLTAVVAALFCMVGVLLFLKSQPPIQEEESSAPAAEKIYLAGGEGKNAVAAVTIQNEGGTFTVKNLKPGEEEAQYTIEGRDRLPLDTYTMGSAGSNAAAFFADELINESPDAQLLKDCGLDKPRATVNIQAEPGGSAVTLEIGGPSPGGDGAYVRVAGQQAVYLCNSLVVDPFLKPETAYVAKLLVGGSPQESTFKRVVLSGSDYPERVVVSETPETAAEVGGVTLGTHGITEPFAADIDTQKGLVPLTALFGLSASDTAAIGDDAATLEKFGLDNPNAVVELTTDLEDVGNVKISFAKAADGSVYAYKHGVPAVFTVNASSLPWMGFSAFDMRSKIILMPFIDELSLIEVETPDGRYTFNLSGEGDALEVTGPGGLSLDAGNFRQFYQTMLAARYSEEVAAGAAEPGEKPEAKPVLQFTYSYRDKPQADVVQFFQGPPRRYFVRLNEGSYYMEQSMYVDRVLQDVKLVAEGQAVKSYF